MLTGGSIIFFTYIGFDSVSTAAEECRNPQRDLPIGIIATLVVCTVLYVAVAVCLTGLVPWQSMVGDAAPVVNALKKLSILPGGHSLHWIRLIVLFGAIMGMLSSILVYQLGQSRVWFSMSRDGLLPKVFSNVHPVFRTPAFSTWVAGIVVAIPSGLFDIGTLADLSNIGTLFAFVLVSIGVIVLRYREPDRRRGFTRSLRARHSCAQRHLLLSAHGRTAHHHLDTASSSGWSSAWSFTSSTAATGRSSPNPGKRSQNCRLHYVHLLQLCGAIASRRSLKAGIVENVDAGWLKCSTMLADLRSVKRPSRNESDTRVIEISGSVEVPRSVLPNSDRLAVSNLIIRDPVGSFAGVTTAFFQIFPNPEVKRVGNGNIHNSTGDHRKRGNFISLR